MNTFPKNSSIVRLLVSFIILCPLELWAQYNEDMIYYHVAQEKSNPLKTELLSKDKSFPYVLAYLDSSTFPRDRLPDHIREWIEDYNKLIALCQDDPLQFNVWLTASSNRTEEVLPLLDETEWGQDYPYNYYCPEIDGKKCPSGCVATALAQIMRFHEWPNNGTGGKKTYITKKHKIPVEFDFDDVTFDWTRIYAKYSQDSTDIEAVATLLQAIGTAVEMDYSLGGSGSNDKMVLQSLPYYFGYDKDMYIAEPDAYTEDAWHQLLQQELLHGRPVYYSGRGVSSGHAFVIDGMKTNEENGLIYYHINWGWDGSCNGYYLLNMLRPTQAGTGGVSGTNYGLQPSMIIGLMPDDGIKASRYMHCKSLDLRSNELFAGQNLSMQVSRLVLRSETDFVGSMKIVMRSLDNQEAEDLLLYEEPKRVITKERGMTNYKIMARIPDSVPPGIYQIELSFQDENNECIQLNMEDWPTLRIKADSEWTGGENMMPYQYIAAKRWKLDDKDVNYGKIAIETDSLCNLASSMVSGYISLIICNTDHFFIAPLDVQNYLSLRGYSVMKDYHIEGHLSRMMPDGNYLLGIGFLPMDSERWSYVYELNDGDDILWCGNTPLFLDMSIEDGIITIGETTIEGADTPWESAIIELPYSNDNGQIYYNINGKQVEHPFGKGIYIKKVKGRWIKAALVR